MFVTIPIPVTDELAAIYERATPDQKAALHRWFTLALQNLATPQAHPLVAAMDALSAEAEANGLTPEVLQSILGN